MIQLKTVAIIFFTCSMILCGLSVYRAGCKAMTQAGQRMNSVYNIINN